MLRWYYSVDSVTVLEITDRVNWPDIGVGAYAEEGSGWSGELLVDDPDGDLMLLCWRRIYAVQDAASGRTNIGNWFISDLDVIRDNPPVGASRKWVVTMADENSLLERRILVGADAVRPAENTIARIRWLLTTTEANTLSTDETYIDTTSSASLPANDYTGQNIDSVVKDCQQEEASGWNYFVLYVGSVAVGGTIVSSSVANPTVITTTTAHGLFTGMQVTIAGHSGSTPSINGTYTVTVTGGSTFTIPVNVTVGGTGGTTTADAHYALAYFNFNTSSLYQSTLSLTNVASEVDIASGVYPIAADTRLARSGMRLASGEYLPFPGGYAYQQNAATGTSYVYRDVTAPSINVKTQAQADARANKDVGQMNEPNDEVTTAIVVEEADLNLAMHGMRIDLHATHLPDYTATAGKPDYANGATMRIKRRDVTQLGPTTFRVGLILTPVASTAPAACYLLRPAVTGLNSGQSNYVGWMYDGDSLASSGEDSGTTGTTAPTVGALHPLPNTLGLFNNTGQECLDMGVMIDGTGTIDIDSSYRIFTACVGEHYVVDIHVGSTMLPGTDPIVVTGTMITAGGFAADLSLSVTGVSVVPGDVVYVYARHTSGSCNIYMDGTGSFEPCGLYNWFVVTGNLAA